MDNANGKSNATKPRARHWKDFAVHLPNQAVLAVCSTEGCQEHRRLEYFDAQDQSTAVTFVHNIPGGKGDEKRCRGVAEDGKRQSQGVFRHPTAKTIASSALARRTGRA